MRHRYRCERPPGSPAPVLVIALLVTAAALGAVLAARFPAAEAPLGPVSPGSDHSRYGDAGIGTRSATPRATGGHAAPVAPTPHNEGEPPLPPDMMNSPVGGARVTPPVGTAAVPTPSSTWMCPTPTPTSTPRKPKKPRPTSSRVPGVDVSVTLGVSEP